jgi:hypothetical protein
MKYNDYLEKGYPIGSGVIEGTCRSLVNDRMEFRLSRNQGQKEQFPGPEYVDNPWLLFPVERNRYLSACKSNPVPALAFYSSSRRHYQ